jgi:hypothetical protein
MGRKKIKDCRRQLLIDFDKAEEEEESLITPPAPTLGNATAAQTWRDSHSVPYYLSSKQQPT